jgi:hypothetical protein
MSADTTNILCVFLASVLRCYGIGAHFFLRGARWLDFERRK